MNKENQTLLRTGHVIKELTNTSFDCVFINYNTGLIVKYVTQRTVRNWLSKGLVTQKEPDPSKDYVLYRLV